MSLLCTVDRAIKSCKADQARINDQIRLYREILQIMRSQPNAASVDSNSPPAAAGAAATAAATAAAPATELSQREKEDLELLERALEKALCVRTGAGHKVKDPNKPSAPLKDSRTSAVPPKERRRTSAAPAGEQINRLTSKSGRPDRKEQKNTASTLLKRADCLGPQQTRDSVHCSNERSLRSSSMTASDDLSQRSRADSDQVAQLESLRRKTNRLWDKVAALPLEPVPGRSHFMERMRATFPADWPHGSPEQTRVLLNRLTHRGCDLAQSYQTEGLLDKQAAEAAAQPGCKLQEKLQVNPAEELLKSVSQAKQEWDAWDRWRPEGGCLCPTGAGDSWGDGRIPPLPPTVTYTTEAELREMETLRIRVALLQQDIFLEQALSNILSPQLSSIVAGRGRPDVSVLRDVYSLLGEGGHRYPAVVLDSEA